MRLLNGGRRAEDLDRIFLYLRTRSYGMKTVRDIGDFIAHADEREQGITWTGLHHTFNVNRFNMSRLEGEYLSHEDFVKLLRACAYLEEPSAPKRDLQIGQRKAHAILETVISKIVDMKSGYNVLLSDELSEAENKVFKYYSTRNIIRPVFDGKTLAAETGHALTRNGLMPQKLTALPDDLTDFVAIYAVTKMHRVRVKFEGHASATLKANSWSGLGISASSVVSTSGLAVGFQAYKSCCATEKWASPLLLKIPQEEWLHHPLEIDDGLITAII